MEDGEKKKKTLVKVLELLGSKGTKLPAFHIQTVAPTPSRPTSNAAFFAMNGTTKLKCVRLSFRSKSSLRSEVSSW